MTKKRYEELSKAVIKITQDLQSIGRRFESYIRRKNYPKERKM